MKDNRKNRKLNYIRNKNNMVKHGFLTSVRISNEFFDNLGKDQAIQIIKKGARGPKFRNYRSELDLNSIRISESQNDFLMNTRTAIIKGKLTKTIIK